MNLALGTRGHCLTGPWTTDKLIAWKCQRAVKQRRPERPIKRLPAASAGCCADRRRSSCCWSLLLALGYEAANRQTPTWDEGMYAVAGYSFWATGDYRLHPENGNWVMRWEALPLWLAGYQFPSLDSPDWQTARSLQLADTFLYGCGNDPDQLIMRSRQMVAVLSAALGLLVYLWSRQLFGPCGGLISLTLYVASPAVLSNGFLATSDMAVTLWFAAATWSIWNVLHRVSPWTVAASCLSLAALFLAKFSAVIIIPIGFLLLAVRLVRGRPLTIALGRVREVRGRGWQLAIFAGVGAVQILLVAIAIWATFGFRYATLASPDHGAPQFNSGPQSDGFSMAAIRFARAHHLLPEAYLYGFQYILAHVQVRHGFLNGQFNLHGFRSFFPYCLAVKTPLSLFVVLGLAGWAVATRGAGDTTGLRGAPASWSGAALRDRALGVAVQRVLGICSGKSHEHRAALSPADLPADVHSGRRGGRYGSPGRERAHRDRPSRGVRACYAASSSRRSRSTSSRPAGAGRITWPISICWRAGPTKAIAILSIARSIGDRISRG